MLVVKSTPSKYKHIPTAKIVNNICMNPMIIEFLPSLISILTSRFRPTMNSNNATPISADAFIDSNEMFAISNRKGTRIIPVNMYAIIKGCLILLNITEMANAISIMIEMSMNISCI